jgi:hypothetical protein
MDLHNQGSGICPGQRKFVILYAKRFAKTCGVHVLNETNPLTEDEMAVLSMEARLMHAKVINYRPATLRALNNLF